MAKRKHGRGGKSKKAQAAFHDRFVKAYIAAGENTTQAYLAVKPHVTPSTAAVEGWKLLKIPNIQKAIESHREELRARFALTTDRVMQELARVAYSNPARLLGTDGKPIALHKLDEDTTAPLVFELDGAGKILKVRTPPPAAKNTALRQATEILHLKDRPLPPPADLTGAQAVDPRDVARRMAFLLAQEAHVSDREARAPPKPVKRKVKLPA